MLAALTVQFFPHPEPFTSFWIPYAQHQFEQVSHVLAAWQEDEGSAFNETEIRPRHGVVANTVRLFRNGAVGFIDWLDGQGRQLDLRSPEAFK